MSNYIFMKSGQDLEKKQIDLENIMVLLTIFTEDALKLCDVYVTHENRTIVTRADTIKALQVRAYYGTEFWTRPDIQEKIEETSKYLKELKEQQEQQEQHEQIDKKFKIDKQEDKKEEIKKEEKLDSLSEYSSDLSEYCSDIELYEDIFQNNICTCDICQKMNSVHFYWKVWNPTNDSDKILKNAINETINKNC